MVPKQNTFLYIPHETEPTPFTIIGKGHSGMTLDWLCWFVNHSKTGVKSGEYKVRLETLHEVVRSGITPDSLYDRALSTITHIHRCITQGGDGYILSAEPPMISVEGPHNKDDNVVSLCWVMDTCIRENMPPGEAYALGKALRKM